MDAIVSGIGATKDNAKDKLNDGLANLVDSRAKGVITQGIDYTLLIVLLLLQYMRCAAPSISDLNLQDIQNTTSASELAYTLYSCDLEENKHLLTWEIATAGGLCLSYGVLLSLFAFIHGKTKFKKLQEVEPRVGKLYDLTSKFILVDNVLEIPISFYWAKYFTVLVWGSFVGICTGLIVTADTFGKKVDDPNMAGVFNTSCFMVMLSLLKLTGEMSKYWVLYNASTLENAKSMLDVFDGGKESGKGSDSSQTKEEVL